MIPKVDYDLQNVFEAAERQPSITYGLNIAKGNVSGKIDELQAVKQSIYKILNTERYQYLIYSWNHGVEFGDLIGESPSYAIPEIKRRITEALMQDDRIIGVDAFSFETERNRVHVTFEVSTIYGNVKTESEVSI